MVFHKTMLRTFIVVFITIFVLLSLPIGGVIEWANEPTSFQKIEAYVMFGLTDNLARKTLFSLLAAGLISFVVTSIKSMWVDVNRY
ncbi:hypothetical protein LGQ02_01560 [Bacillus shivajii]|uniref:hypothetical protein n=1 Tax=Bacillus shivajii TaxID=1983719 RepID=UPI001CF9519C|nr:hypothetical protein [Bacillus shivajii]UCZ53514.1 hypothetical protein LGQ02_01560 [Bacillus shivajii]